MKILSRILLCCAFFCSMRATAQIVPFDTLVSNGSDRKILFNTSTWGSGFGHKIYSIDPGSRTDLRIAGRHNSADWKDLLTISSLGNVGIGNSNPLTLLHTTAFNNTNNTSAFIWGQYWGVAMSVADTLPSRYAFSVSSHQNSDGQPASAKGIRSLLYVRADGNVGIGLTSPAAGLHVAKVAILENGERAAAILGNTYLDWTYFGASTGGKIRGSNEGYLALETNSKGSDKNIYMNTSSAGNVIMATGGGNVCIGTARSNGYKLAVEGTIGARKIKVEQVAWADYVFHPEYKLPTLQSVEDYITAHKHLPDIPSDKEVKENGLDLGDMNKRLLQKVEELTLYLISQDKKLENVQQRMTQLEQENAAMKKQLEENRK
ncbi:MAG TPA: hypothetical protein VM802_17510 [Chitinophaga sp.]|uniref:hypothetical protein n=1 Tax=Chitinophaga sp. TaxID=1869181 RepID=UPI002C71BEB5|nr:hypothetical protein [Chitinophaga sp.]HVI46680.1 hypothetical protein [Chitinophaga sp.]